MCKRLRLDKLWIIVELPGISEKERALDLFGRTAQRF